MKIRRIFQPFAAAALAASVAACSGSPAAAPPTQNTFQSRGTLLTQFAAPHSPALLFASTGRQNLIQIYDAAAPHTLVGQITTGLSGPNALAVDTKGNLWVVNVDGRNVAEYAPGSTKPSFKITRGLNNPLTVAVGNDGTVYISDINDTTGAGKIFEFPEHQITPSFTISLPAAVIGLAVDAKNNVFATTANLSTGASRVLEFAPKSTKGTDLGIKLKFAGRMAVDSKDNLIIIDQTAPAVEVFAPGSNKPSNEITSGFTDPFGVALNHDSTRLFVGDGAGDTINVYTYPGLKFLNKIARTAATFGVAVNPPAPI
ncbi:MAG TPA: hypothetical protein VGZ02_05070 [Candidatus Baltobacteraceae bacterium]|jgi:DNA-binding beta-propeller fold protein YncE|nr:hypothetical protein [Candidatus Baltobacteraceae bacterium]